MNMISEQVEELRKLAKWFEAACLPDGAELASKAADTIEFLSEKLQTVNIIDNSLCKVILYDIEKEIEEMKSIWSGLEKPPYNEFEQELFISGLRKAREIVLQVANIERTTEDCGGWIPCSTGKMPHGGTAVLIRLRHGCGGIDGVDSNDNGSYDISFLRSSKNEWVSSCGTYPSEDVVAWMPIKPYKSR